MKRRLQQMEEDGEKINESYENSITNDDMEGNKKVNFRFPIVSDHEIYGWEKEIEHNEYTKDYLQQELEEEYEKIPLYQNARWPGRFEQEGKVYRSEPKSESPKPSTIAKIRPKAAQVKSTPVKEALPKVPRRPFSPSEVPSPIYGYVKSTPVLSAMEEAKLRRKQKDAMQTEELEETQAIDDLDLQQAESVDVVTEIEEVPAEMTSDSGSIEELTQPLAVEEFESRSNEVAVAESFVMEEQETEEIEDEVQEVQEVETETETDSQSELPLSMSDTSTISAISDEEEDTTAISEAPMVAVREIEQLEVAESETDEFDAEEAELGEVNEEIDFVQTIEENAESQKKEKIIPFNVLMLQSDKEKLAMKHAQSSLEDKNVQEAVQKKQPLVEKTVIKPSVAQAVQPIKSMEDEVDEEPLPSYAFPPLNFLAPPEEEVKDEEWLESQSAKLEEALSYFSIQATVMQAVQGPAVTMFELTVEQGVKVSKIRNLTDDLKLALAARDIRIQAPIPGTSLIGVEIPNRQTRAVRISEVIESEPFKNSDSPLEAVLGLSLTGEPQTIDLRKMPHGMIAGATGSGKSVCINSLLISLLYKASYHDLKLLLIDPKMVELAPYNGIPHLLSPVITDVKAATAALKWAVEEMERRYELFAHSGVRNIERYNEMVMESRRFSLKMPYMLIVIDELADLMMMAPADVEISISRITQKARACGIHLIIATQRPSVDVITGTIKANIPTRIAFAVSSQVDSRTILDSVGAERLLGKGDMLYLGNGQSASIRLQGTFVTDDEIERIIEHVRNEAEPDYLFGQEDLLATAIQEEEMDPLFQQACSFIIEQGSASTSMLQRHFSIGYNRAAKLMDRMEANQFISEQKGSKPRDVFLTHQALENFLN
ncbi:DNA segregation ATPase FtsK/SpoIIIE, S-DNA-T family [Sporosarcina newyorkensis]|uniref:DNA segregation ATPase FtsK/SpoIIIE, S-DNA-T family n=2 Tax=Sporosarcina newyorkensis TaxID=759851 RepID=A0A1T4XRM7_9BACL|nr:DNA segregation ATPase FtsK/SpoIIIE, S-DNA-T family [Sporosarcina newyorkensis]